MRLVFLLAFTASAATAPFFTEEALRAGLKDVFICGDDRQ